MTNQELHRRLDAFIKRVAYKPDHHIILEPFIFEGRDVYRVAMHMTRLPKAPQGVGTIELTFADSFRLSLVHPDRPEEWMANWLFDFVLKWERHEAAEWLKIDGKHVSNPHPENSQIEMWDQPSTWSPGNRTATAIQQQREQATTDLVRFIARGK